MLGKLLKYDLKADVVFYYIMTAIVAGATLLVVGAMMLMDKTNYENPFIDMSCVSMMFIYFIVVVAAIIFTAVVIFKRFYSHNFAQEGYLTFTLPVTANQIFWSKFISALIWIVWTGFLVIASVTIMVFSIPVVLDVNDFVEIYDVFSSVYKNTDLLLILNLLNNIISIPLTIFVIYLSVCIGQNFTVHRVIAAVGAYFIINIGLSIVTSVLSTIILVVCELGSDMFDSFVVYSNASIIIEILISIAVMIFSYFYCIRKMSRGLNLR